MNDLSKKKMKKKENQEQIKNTAGIIKPNSMTKM